MAQEVPAYPLTKGLDIAGDRRRFEGKVSSVGIGRIKPIMPFRYLLSGGVSLCGFAPCWSFGLWRRIENALHRWRNQLAMFAQIVLRRVD